MEKTQNGGKARFSVSISSAEAQLQFAIEQYRLYRRTDSIPYCQKKMPMLLEPIKCLHLAIKDTLVGVDVDTRVCSYREFFSWLLCAFYGHLLILWFARSSREDMLILFAVARLPDR